MILTLMTETIHHMHKQNNVHANIDTHLINLDI